jgi:thiamine-phosphate pyrophosphorylase
MRHPGTAGLADRQILTVSAHGVRALQRALAIGANAALIAPAFETMSHAGSSGLGIHRLQRLAGASPLPFYVLGGITAKTMKRLPPLKKMAGVAGISLYMK